MLKKPLCLLSSILVLLPTAYAQNSTVTTTTTITQPAYTTTDYQSSYYLPFEIKGIYWYPEISGHVHVSDNSQSTNVNLRSDLGLNDHMNVPGAELLFNLNDDNSFRATYMYLHDTGSNSLSRTIVYDGHTYTGGTPITSKMTTQYFSLGWLFNFLHLDNDRLNGGLVVDIKGISTRATIDSSTFGSRSEDFTGAAPTVGLSLRYKIINPLSIYAEGEGIPAGRYGYFYDVQGGLKVKIIRGLDLSAGYRMIEAKVDYNAKNSGEINFKGPYAGLTVKF